MIQHGHLDMPIIGAAKSGWSLDQVKDRAHDSIKEHGSFNSFRPQLAIKVPYPKFMNR
jgi:glucose-6-phosphate 1-dehydrogenase